VSKSQKVLSKTRFKRFFKRVRTKSTD
jgi:hypothetical protein